MWALIFCKQRATSSGVLEDAAQIALRVRGMIGAPRASIAAGMAKNQDSSGESVKVVKAQKFPGSSIDRLGSSGL